MRVALVVTDLQPGGTPLRLTRLARRLVATGIEVHVGCLARPGPLSHELDRDCVPTFSADAANSQDIAAVFRLREIIRKISPDLIHATLTHANVACRWISRKLKIPVLTSTATIEVERPWHVRLERWTQRCDAGHLVNSQSVADHVHRQFGVPQEKIHIVPPSLEPWPQKLNREQARALLKVPAECQLILWAGRFDPVKQVERLVDCMRALPSSAHLCLAGDVSRETEYLGSTRRRVDDGKVGDRVHFLGWQSDLSAALSAADIFAFPSLTEGMPNAVLNAMAAGLPIVASDIPAHRELAGRNRMILVDDRKNDRLQSWVTVLGQLLVDAQRRKELGQAAEDWAKENLDPAATTAATIETYKKILATWIGMETR